MKGKFNKKMAKLNIFRPNCLRKRKIMNIYKRLTKYAQNKWIYMRNSSKINHMKENKFKKSQKKNRRKYSNKVMKIAHCQVNIQQFLQKWKELRDRRMSFPRN